jgi:hypothetical protein
MAAFTTENLHQHMLLGTAQDATRPHCCPSHHFPGSHLLLQGMKVAVIEGHDIGGTCVNRGCVPSKALLAASGRIRDMQNEMHMKSMGIQVTAILLNCVACAQFVLSLLAGHGVQVYVMCERCCRSAHSACTACLQNMQQEC